MVLSGAELFVKTIAHLGIRELFTLVGDHLNEVLAVARREGMRIIDTRHETGALHAADALARILRRPTLSLVTGGPGHTNSITGLATAYLAASPLIAVSGAPASHLVDRQAFQDIDQVGLAAPISKWAAQPPGTAQIPFFLARAYAEANTGRRGAVHLTIPVDLFTVKTEWVGPFPAPPPPLLPQPAGRDIDAALALLARAKRPLVIAGSGVWWSNAEAELQTFIEKTSLPLYTITLGRGVVSDEHPLCMGYGDPALNRAAATALREADVIMVIGKRIDYRLALGGERMFSPDTAFIQLDIHPQELGMNRKLEVAICADAKAGLSALAQAAGAHQNPRHGEWLERVRALKAEWQQQIAGCAQERSLPLHPAAFYNELKYALPANVLYSWDGGDFAHWGRVSLPARTPGGWLRLGPLGGIGAALSNGIGLKFANPDKPVVVFTGDGSLGFYIAEVDTAVRHKLPIVIVVGNDAGWGLERELQQAMYPGEETVSCELRATRYDQVIQGFGGGGETIETLDQVQPAMKRALASGVPYCLNVMIRGARSPFTEWQILGRK